MVENENAWRREACPAYGELHCPHGHYCHECHDEYHCNDIYNLVEYYIADLDSNNDDNIDIGGYLDTKYKYDTFIEMCDTDHSGNVSRCELFNCFIMEENAWRLYTCAN
jgi:hypothetical protein